MNYRLAYSTDSRTSKLPKGILGWASGAERSEGNISSEGNMTGTLSAPLPLHSAHMLQWRHMYAN